jgi:GTPase involved in cell partitioning and DNA repair
LQNFPILAMKLNKIQEELREEREILVWNKVDKITEIILKNRKNKIKKDIEKLKGEVWS